MDYCELTHGRNMRIYSALLVASLAGCFQPTSDELVDSGVDAGIGADAGIVVQPEEVAQQFWALPPEELSCGEHLIWQQPLRPDWVNYSNWATIWRIDGGAYLVNALAGVPLLDGGYVLPAPAYRDAATSCNYNWSNWFFWRGAWHRPLAKQYAGTTEVPSVEFWRLDDTTLQVNSIGGYASTHLDAGTVNEADNPTQFGTYVSHDGMKLLVVNLLLVNPSPGETRVFSSPDEFGAAPLLNRYAFPVSDLRHDDSWLIATSHGGLVEFSETSVNVTPLDFYGRCLRPMLPKIGVLDFACPLYDFRPSELGIDIFQGDHSGIQKTQLRFPYVLWPAVLIQTEPLRFLSVEGTDAGQVFVNSCTADGCTPFHELFTWPPNVGIDNGALLIADWVPDAGLRITRFPDGRW